MSLFSDKRNSSEIDFSLCGANDCPLAPVTANTTNGTSTGKVDDQIITLMSIYLAVGIMAAILIGLLLDKIKVLSSERKDRGVCSLFLATIRHLKDVRMQLLIPLTIFSGLEQGFVFGDFTKVSMVT